MEECSTAGSHHQQQQKEDGKENKDFKQKTLKSIKNNINKLLWRRKSITITQYDSTYKVSYLGNVLCGWTKGESCIDKPIKTLWSNYKQNSKPNVQMKITITQSGLKAITKQHGLTEYWSNRITYCIQPSQYPKIFCWIYRHEGRKLKQELRCHAVLCSKEIISKKICNELNLKLSQALTEFKKDKILKQNARLSLANCVYDNPSLPRRKLLLSTGSSNYKPPLERSKSAPKLMAIEESLEEEDTLEDHQIDYKKYSNYYLNSQYGGTLKYIKPNNSHYNKFNSLKFNRSKSTLSQLNRNNSLDSILETNNSNSSDHNIETIFNSTQNLSTIDQSNEPTKYNDDQSQISLPIINDENRCTNNEQLSINFNPNFEQTAEISISSNDIITNPDPINIKEYEININPKFNLIKSNNNKLNNNKNGKLLRNKSLDSILDNNSYNEINNKNNIHRKSWCYGEENNILFSIDNEPSNTNNHSMNNISNHSNSNNTIGNHSNHNNSSFEHINYLIEQASSIFNLSSNSNSNKTICKNTPTSCDEPDRAKDVKAKNNKSVDNKFELTDPSEDSLNSKENIKNSVPHEQNVIEKQRTEKVSEINDTSNILNNNNTIETNNQINKLLKNRDININYDEFLINAEDEENEEEIGIYKEYNNKNKIYSHHRLPSIESGFHDQIDSDSLLETNLDSASSGDSLTSLQELNIHKNNIVGDHFFIPKNIMASENVTNNTDSTETNDKITMYETKNSTVSERLTKDDSNVSLATSSKANESVNNNTFNVNSTNNNSHNLSNITNKIQNLEIIDNRRTPDENDTNTITTNEVKKLCKNTFKTNNKGSNNTFKKSKIFDKINSFNEKIEINSTNSKIQNSKNINKPITNENERTRSNDCNDNAKTIIEINQNKPDETPSVMLDTISSVDNIENINIISNGNIFVDNNEIKNNQNVKNKIKEFNAFKKYNNNNETVVINKVIDNITNSNCTNINNSYCNTIRNNNNNTKVTITKTIRKNNTNGIQKINKDNTFNSNNKYNTISLPKQISKPSIINNINKIENVILSTQSLDYSINNGTMTSFNTSSSEDVDNKINNTNSLVKKRKQMFENNYCNNKNNTGGIVNRLASRYCNNINNSANRNSIVNNNNDDDSDESGYVESQEIEAN